MEWLQKYARNAKVGCFRVFNFSDSIDKVQKQLTLALIMIYLAVMLESYIEIL